MKGPSLILAVVMTFVLLAGACTSPTPAAAPPTAIPPTAVPPTAVPTQAPPTAAPPTQPPPAPAPTQAPAAAAGGMSDEEKTLRTYLDARAKGDLEAVAALFANTAEGGFTYAGTHYDGSDAPTFKKALQDGYEYVTGIGEVDEVASCAPMAKAVVCKLAVKNAACIKAQCGFDVWHSDATIRLKNGKIVLLSFTDSLDDRKACEAPGYKFARWADANRPDDWRHVQEGTGYFKTVAESAKAFNALCQAYLDSQK